MTIENEARRENAGAVGEHSGGFRCRSPTVVVTVYVGERIPGKDAWPRYQMR